MRNFQEALSKNPLRTKTDLEEALVDLVTPVYECMAQQGTPWEGPPRKFRSGVHSGKE